MNKSQASAGRRRLEIGNYFNTKHDKKVGSGMHTKTLYNCINLSILIGTVAVTVILPLLRYFKHILWE